MTKAQIVAFIWGVREFRSAFTKGYPGDADPDLNDAYDWGREWAHRLTLRRYDESHPTCHDRPRS